MTTILCSGSRGDFQPYIALAQQLQKLGKSVRIAGGKSFEGLITGYGIGFYPLSVDYQTAEVDPQIIKDAQSSDNPLKMLLTFNKMKAPVLHLTQEMYAACEGSELIIYHPGATIGRFAGEILGIPSVLATPFSMHKTKEVASVIAYGRYKLPTRFTYAMLQQMLWMVSKPGVKACLKAKFGKLPKKFGCPYERVDARHPAVVSCSNHVFPRPGDWNENIHQFGYWFVEENAQYTPPRELLGFLKSGDAPVYFGFGSVFNSDEKEHFVGIITDALQKCGKRGVLCGMGKVSGLPDTVFVIDSIPHSWLFPRCAAVCHHGGAGTTAAGFAAGVPSANIPFSNDQFAWAHRAFDLGVGSKPIQRKELDSAQLADAISFAMQTPVVKKAQQLGECIRGENGAALAAKTIVEIMN
ncbi:glycosyltransferase [Ruminococcaceae bacterium OttesenSCG-928-I18]|nr:glycosyltransferase [Ruminococcaceae bacterium OttesenSCG-928-I18]